MKARILMILPLFGCAELESLLEDVADAAEDGGVCAAEAFRGDIFMDSSLENTFDLVGSFDDMIFPADTQTFAATISLSRLGHDASGGVVTDCDYTGMAVGHASGANAAGMEYTGIAEVISAHPERDGCLADPQQIDISMVVPFSCDTIDADWVHDPDDSLGTGQGHFSVSEVYTRAEVVGGGDTDPGDTDPGDDPVDDTDPDTDPDVEPDEDAVTAQGCPLDTEMMFSGPLVAENGCNATLNTINSIDETGHLTGSMWLTEMSGNCQLIEAEMDAQVSEDGTVIGTVTGQVQAHAGVVIVDECQEMVDGWFRINEWDDADLATYWLERVK